MAIGAQNIFVIRTATSSRLGWFAALVSSVCDCFLIGVGIGMGAGISEYLPLSTELMQMIAAIFLFGFAFMQLLNAKRTWSKGISSNTGAGASNTLKVFSLGMGFSLLNPHAYLDTVLLIGGASINLVASDKLYFGTGAALASFTWFFGIAAIGRYFSDFFAKKKTSIALDLASASVMSFIGAALIFG